MTLPSRIRGPRSKARRKANGYGLEERGSEYLTAYRVPSVVRRSRAHCDFVRDHGCVIEGCDRRPIEVAHVRTGTGGGMGMKPSDRWTISLCGGPAGHHAEQHRIGEASFEAKYGIDMKALARAFVTRSPKRVLLERMP